MKLFNDKAFRSLEQSLSFRFQRHALIAGNIANASTPKYRARDLDFKSQLEAIAGQSNNELKKTHPNHMDTSSSKGSHVVYDNSGAVKADGNNVDIDIAMGKLSANARAYQSAATLMSMKMRVLRKVARGGGGI